MPTVRELITRFGFEVDTKELDKLEGGISSIKEGLAGLGAMVIGSAASIFALVKASANAADKIYDTAAAVGVATDELQRLGYAAQLNGSNIDDMSVGLKFLNKNLYEAAHNAGGQTAQDFKKLGVAVKDSRGQIRPASAVLLDIADKMQKMKSPTEKAGTAMNFLGKGGSTLVQTLEKGSKVIRQYGDELESMGGVLSNKQLEDLGAFNDALDRIWALFKGIGMSIAANLAPTLTEVVDEFRKFVVQNREVIKTNIVGFIKGLSSFLLAAWRVLKIFGTGLAAVTKLFGGMEVATKIALAGLSLLFSAMVLSGFKTLISVVRLLGTEFVITWLKALWPIALIIAAVAALFLVIEDLVAFFNGDDSITGLLVDGIAKYFKIFADKLSDFLLWVGDVAKGWASDFGNWILSFFQPFIDMLKSIGDGMTSLAKGDFSGVTSAVKGIFSSGTATGVTPSNSPAGDVSNNKNQQYNVTAPITVTVPAGTDPTMVGEKAESGISLGLEGVLRNTQRASSPGVAY